MLFKLILLLGLGVVVLLNLLFDDLLFNLQVLFEVFAVIKFRAIQLERI